MHLVWTQAARTLTSTATISHGILPHCHARVAHTTRLCRGNICIDTNEIQFPSSDVTAIWTTSSRVERTDDDSDRTITFMTGCLFTDDVTHLPVELVGYQNRAIPMNMSIKVQEIARGIVFIERDALGRISCYAPFTME